MARNFTVQELFVLREHLKQVRTSTVELQSKRPAPVQDALVILEFQIAHMLPVLEALVDALGESADLTLLARKNFEEASGGTPR